MATYIVLDTGSVWHRGKLHLPGAELEMTTEEAASVADRIYEKGTQPPRKDPLEAVPNLAIGGGLDLGLVRDATGLALVARKEDQYSVRVAFGFKRRGGADALSLEALCPRIAELCLRHGCHVLYADGHEFTEAQRHLQKAGVYLERFPGGPNEKLASWAFARSAFTDGKLFVPASAQQLKRELRSTGHKLTPGGRIEIVQPRKGGTHGDLASALVLALYGAQHAVDGAKFADVQRLVEEAIDNSLEKPLWYEFDKARGGPNRSRGF